MTDQIPAQSQISAEDAREVIRLVLVAQVEGRDSDLAWTLARRLASEHGMPMPVDDHEALSEANDDLDWYNRNDFYWDDR